MMKRLLCTLVMLAFVSHILGYKILLVVPIPARSHWILLKAQADILHEHGHEVTLISCYASKDPLYREIDLKETPESCKSHGINFGLTKTTALDTLQQLTYIGERTAIGFFNNAAVKQMLNDRTEKFDLVIVEHFMNDMFIGLGVKYNCPVIASSTTSVTHWIARVSGNPITPATAPHLLTAFPTKMNLWQRAVNFAISVFDDIFFTFMLKPSQERLYNKFFSEESKKVSFSDLPQQVAFIFLNTHPSIGVARPLLPNTVEVGGYHIQKAGKLPEDLQKLLDTHKDGVIYFSMGSNLNSADLSLELRSDLLKFFGSLKQTILWKFEEDLPGKPDNVVISSWLPQAAILAHPNLRVFITHGGLLSLTESASAGVPLVVIPIFGDQYNNAAAVVERGQGVRLDYDNFTADSLSWALEEVLNNPSYAKSVKTIKQRYHDRLMDPREVINFYAENVIRTGGAPHYSPRRLCLFSILFLDVAAVFLLPPLLLLLGLFLVCRRCCKRTIKIDKKKKQ